MNVHTDRLVSDVAVLEQHFGAGNEWRTLAFIGPDRSPVTIDPFVLHTGMSIRVRYLESEHDRVE